MMDPNWKKLMQVLFVGGSMVTACGPAIEAHEETLEEDAETTVVAASHLDAGSGDAGIDAGTETDAGLPRVYCWLVLDPRCGTPEVVDAC